MGGQSAGQETLGSNPTLDPMAPSVVIVKVLECERTGKCEIGATLTEAGTVRLRRNKLRKRQSEKQRYCETVNEEERVSHRQKRR